MSSQHEHDNCACITAEELAALPRTKSSDAKVLYLLAILPFIDRLTLEFGRLFPKSRHGLADALFVAGHPGVKGSGKRKSVHQIDRLLTDLIDAGLLVRRSNSLMRELIFYCPLARQSNSVQNKAAAQPATYPAADSHRGNGHNPRPKPRPKPRDLNIGVLYKPSSNPNIGSESGKTEEDDFFDRATAETATAQPAAAPASPPAPQLRADQTRTAAGKICEAQSGGFGEIKFADDSKLTWEEQRQIVDLLLDSAVTLDEAQQVVLNLDKRMQRTAVDNPVGYVYRVLYPEKHRQRHLPTRARARSASSATVTVQAPRNREVSRTATAQLLANLKRRRE